MPVTEDFCNVLLNKVTKRCAFLLNIFFASSFFFSMVVMWRWIFTDIQFKKKKQTCRSKWTSAGLKFFIYKQNPLRFSALSILQSHFKLLKWLFWICDVLTCWDFFGVKRWQLLYFRTFLVELWFSFSWKWCGKRVKQQILYSNWKCRKNLSIQTASGKHLAFTEPERRYCH